NKLYAFDAQGNVGCSGSPKTCAPLWTGTAGGVIASSPAVWAGVVYVESGSTQGTLAAFDATGIVNCSGSPKSCTPLWTASIGSSFGIFPTPAIADGTVYVGAPNGTLYWFDAAGTNGCSGAPKICTPLATATPGGSLSTATVTKSIVYVPSSDHHVYAFDN